MRAHDLWGLPPAEHPVRRHWRSVEGGTVLNQHFNKNIGYEAAKVKLIVFMKSRKKGNRRGTVDIMQCVCVSWT
jgi:hypothetical protein